MFTWHHSWLTSASRSIQEQMLPLGTKAIIRLLKTIKQPQLSVVFCENDFTSFSLVHTLYSPLGLKCVVIMWPNHTGRAPLTVDKDQMKRGHGAFYCRSAEQKFSVKCLTTKNVDVLSKSYGIMSHSSILDPMLHWQRLTFHAHNWSLPTMNVWIDSWPVHSIFKSTSQHPNSALHTTHKKSYISQP